MVSGTWTWIFAAITVGIYLLQPGLGLPTLRRALGLTFFLELFYLIGSYLADWPFPTPLVIFQVLIVTGLGVQLGAIFSKVWPLPFKPGFERVMRTFLIVIPALGLGIGLQILLQGKEPTQALYLIFALAAWLGSGRYVRQE